MKVERSIEDRTIKVRWKISGIKFLKMAVYFLPKKLWVKDNLNDNADTFYEGVSTFYWDEKANKIIKHIADNKMEDTEREAVKKPVEKIKEKLQKLTKEQVPNPSI